MNSFNWYGKNIVLASKSERRVKILKLINLNFKIHPSNYNENNSNISPTSLVLNHAYKKAEIVAPFYENSWIISADTIVVANNKILGKPKDKNEAIDMLKILSGITHIVYTGYCIMNSDNHKALSGRERTKVTFREIPNDLIEYYVDYYRPYDKAGAYAIQDFSAVFVKEINGCFYNVVGFPLPKFYNHAISELQKCL
jgi:septum formation protein